MDRGSADGESFVMGLIFGGVLTLFTMIAALSVLAEPEGKAAVDAGVAVWVADPQTGQTTLKYGCPCQEKK